MRMIGAEVPPENGGEYGTVLREFRIGTGPCHIVMSRMKVVFFAILFSFSVVLMVLSTIFLIDPTGIIYLLIVIIIAFFGLIGFILLLSGLMLIALSRSILKGNRVYLTEKGVLVKHQFWVTTPLLTNLIPYERILDVRAADEEYFEQVKASSSLWKRLNYMGVPPPAGGLYHTYSNKEGLMILFLDRPLSVRNMVFGKVYAGVPRFEERWVREVIIDVHPLEQNEFIERILGEKRKDSRPRMVNAPPVR